jgi:hypothetical protein
MSVLRRISGMDQSIEEFLRAEYETAWAHIREIDNRRLRFAEFYISLNAVLSTAITAVITHANGPLLTFGNVTLIFVGAVIAISAGIAILGMLRSERQANIRFRRRVNYIRGFFLENTSDIKIEEYLRLHAELNTPTDKTENLSRHGTTLKYVFRLIFGTLAIWVSAALVMLSLTLARAHG